MRELLHSRSSHGKHHHRSEADDHETTKAAAWAVFQHHGGGSVQRHHLYRHSVRRVTRFKIEAQMKHALAHHSTSHMPTDAIHVNWDAGSTLFDSFELDSLCKQLDQSFHPPNLSSDDIDHPEPYAFANPNPNPSLGPLPQHGHPGLHDPTEDADAHHYQVGRGLSLVDGVLVPITVRGQSIRVSRKGGGHGDGHGSGMRKVCGPNLVNRTPMFPCCVVRCGFRTEHHIDVMCLKDIGLCVQDLLGSMFNGQHKLRDRWHHLRSKSKIFTLRMNKVFVWAPKVMRKMAATFIWIC